MRCAIYCRVSTDDQNLDRQVDELREFAARMKWELDGEYSDKLSGAQRSRPGLDAMMEAAERREFDVLTVWALDRVGRSTLHTLEIVEKLDALGIHFRSYTQGAIDTTSPTGKLVLTILAGVAEMERSQIRDRVRSGLSAARKRGNAPFILGPPSSVAWSGSAPFSSNNWMTGVLRSFQQANSRMERP